MVLPEFKLDGKVAIVTGAGRGIGKTISLTMAEAGADITVADIDPKTCAETREEIKRLGRRCFSIPTDVTKADQVQNMVERTISELGGVDILVNNAGTLVFKPLVPMPGVKSPSPLFQDFEKGQSEEDWHKVINTNLTSVFLCCRAVGPHMIERRSGKVINIASMEAAKAIVYHTSYAASKAGVRLLTQALALEWARYNINVNAIGPGPMPTDMMAAVIQDERLTQRFIQGIPLRRWGNLREIGLLAVYLASDASNYMTGQTVFIDGGVLA